VLERVPEHFKVIRHVRPKLSCASCERIVQVPAPSRADRARNGRTWSAGPCAGGQVLRSSAPVSPVRDVRARRVELERSTLADWVGGASRLLNPLVETISRHVLAPAKLHADDIPVPMLAPGNGKTKRGRLWTYVRDDRPAGDITAPAVWFVYSPDRRGEHPRQHLGSFRGFLQADGYAGFHHLYDGGEIQEAACWACAT
jgi:transposase